MKIVMIASLARSLVDFRGPLIKEFIARDHDVVALAPKEGLYNESDADIEERLRGLGVRFIDLPLQRTGLNVFRDIQVFIWLVKHLKELQPDVILSYTIKPVVYGSLAAQRVRVPRIYSMITGLGRTFSTSTVKSRILNVITRNLYRAALRINDRIFFQNSDDASLFQRLKLVTSSQITLINGSGVDLEAFPVAEFTTKPMTFLFIARLIPEKGILEFVEAARIVKRDHKDVTFQILGPHDSANSGISANHIREWQNDQLVEYLGETNDVRPFIAQSSVFVLPTYYREGTPRSVLEAMAMGRAIITSNAPGCRETVEEGKNGYLVPVKDANVLAKTMKKFINDPTLVRRMGQHSRTIAEAKYDVYKVNKVILEAMGLA